MSDDPAPRAQPGGADDRLEEVDRRRVGDDDLPGGGTDEPADAVADPLWRAPPVRLVPRPDEPLAPLPLDDVGQGGGHGAGQRAQRVAVEVDDVVREGEQPPPVPSACSASRSAARRPGRRGRPPSDVSDPGDATRRSPTTPHVMTSFPTFRSEGVETSSRAEKRPGQGRGSHGLGRHPTMSRRSAGDSVPGRVPVRPHHRRARRPGRRPRARRRPHQPRRTGARDPSPGEVERSTDSSSPAGSRR